MNCTHQRIRIEAGDMSQPNIIIPLLIGQPMDSMLGILGDKLMGSSAEIIMIATG